MTELHANFPVLLEGARKNLIYKDPPNLTVNSFESYYMHRFRLFV